MSAEVEVARRRGLADLYFFARNVLGYKLMVPHVHRPMCDFIVREIERSENEQATKILLEPRGSFKSSVGTIAYALWMLVRDPNMSILITNEKLDKAKAFLKELKSHITDNETFKLLYGDLSCEKAPMRRWSDARIDIQTRTKHGAAPSVEASSVESSETGKHVELIICDDLVGKSNSGTPEQLRKVDDYVKDLGAVLNPGGTMLFIGTRWDYRDTYNTQLEFIKDLGKFSRADVLIESSTRENGSLFFPERLSEQFLKSQRAKLGTYFFSCQYQNNPVSREDALVKTISKYGAKIGDEPSSEFFDTYCKNFVTGDFAYTENVTSDSTVLLVSSVDQRNGNLYVRYWRKWKTNNPVEVIEELFRIDEEYKPVKYGLEKNNYINWLKHPLERSMRERSHYLNLDPRDGLPHYGPGSNKNARLRNLAPNFNFGNWFIKEDMTELEDQLLLLTYDGVKGHDDLLDALVMQDEIIFWGAEDTANKYENEEVRPMGDEEWGKYGTVATPPQKKNEWMYS